jgi:hypothetical protein
MTRGKKPGQSNIRGKGHQGLQQPQLAPIDSTPIRRALPAAGERRSPRNRQSSIINYARLERIEEIMVNPPQSRTPSALRQVINVFDDDAPVSPDVTDNSPDSPSHGRERPELPLPTTVTLRKAREDGVKIRQAPKERTYTKSHFEIKQLDFVWCKMQNKGSPWYQDRLWSCKYCTYTSTDSSRHGNITNTGRHLVREHGLTKDMHLRGDRVEVKRDESGTIEAFLRQAEPEPSPEEAFLRFFIQTNQPFSM